MEFVNEDESTQRIFKLYSSNNKKNKKLQTKRKYLFLLMPFLAIVLIGIVFFIS